MIFWRHQQKDESVCELNPIQRHHTHVKEDPKQHRKRDLTQNISDDNGQAYKRCVLALSVKTKKAAVVEFSHHTD